MTTPGGDFPDDAITNDDIAALDGLNKDDWEMGVRNKAIDPYNRANDNLGTRLAALWDQIVNAFVQGANAIGMAAINVFNGIVDAITGIFDGIASALGFGGSQDADGFSVGSVLADIRDGQRALIGKIDQLGDNAGFCNLVMANNWFVDEHALNNLSQMWLGSHYDTYITQHKNCHKETVNVPHAYLPTQGIGMNGYGGMRCSGIVFDAPGVWQLNALTTISIGTPSDDGTYYESSIFVFKLSASTGPGGYYEAAENYSETRVTGLYGRYESLHGIPVTKSILIPEDADGNVDGNGYVAVVATRIWEQHDWTVSGGAVYSQFAANRFSTDAKYYDQHDGASGTVTVD